MQNIRNTKEVYFNVYCQTCEYEKTDEHDDPCNECLCYGSNENSHKPVKWTEKRG